MAAVAGIYDRVDLGMEDFEAVRTKLRRVNVTAPDYGNSHGVLSLDGDDSVIELSGNLPLRGAEPPGWFNLRLDDANGRTIYIHNALRTGMTFPQGSDVRSETIFPNMVVNDARGLDDQGRCQQIEFSLDGWEACFPYNFFETLDVFGPPPDALRSSLEAARFDFQRDEPFEPYQVYIANNLGTFIEFQANDRQYAISARTSQSLGNNDRLSGRALIVGRIIFPERVDLEVATDACWEWRRFFNQMAMSEMPFTGMAVAATADRRAPRGSLYFPNERPSPTRRSRRSADAYYMPLNAWGERGQLSEAMRTWLAQDGDRRFFRAALDRVIARPGHVAIEDAVALCAGVDTLSELASRESIPRPVLEAMANAAVAAAAEGNVEIDPLRARGLLGSLQNDDLRRRLRRLVSLAAPEVEAEAMERWIDVIIPLRLFGAHGRTPATDQDHIAGPAVEGLAALCARFDLQDAGVPDHRNDRARSLPTIEWDQALLALAMHRQQSEQS